MIESHRKGSNNDKVIIMLVIKLDAIQMLET